MKRKSSKTGAKRSPEKPTAHPGKDKVDVLVSVSKDHLDRIQELADCLQAEGLDVGQVLSHSGVITGSVDADKVEEIRGVTGVADVEPSRTYHLAPPDSSVQ